MFRKMLLVTAAVVGMVACSGGNAEAGHCRHGHGGGGYGYRGGYGGGYGGYSSYGYGGPSYGYGGVRVVPAPMYPYAAYPGYGYPYGGSPYGYGGYAPYGSAIGVRSGNFSMFLGR